MNSFKLKFFLLLSSFIFITAMSFAREDVHPDAAPKKETGRKEKKLRKAANDSTQNINHSKYMLTKRQFLEKYGVDDTSRALIKYYFSHRGAGAGYLCAYGALAVIEFALIMNWVEEASRDNDDIVTISAKGIAILYTIVVFIPSHVLLGMAANRISKYSKKNLYIDLMNYLKGHSIPEKHLKKMIRHRFYWKNV